METRPLQRACGPERMAELQPCDVTAFLDASTSIQEVSKLFEGLCRLDRRGRIRLSLKPRRSRDSHPRVVELRASNSSAERAIAVDLGDQRDLFHLPALEAADIYFKRSFHLDALQRLQPKLASKVRPFGLNNPAADVRTSLRVVAARARTGRSWAELATDVRQMLALPPPSAFECEPDVAAWEQILFQTRLWPGDAPDVVAINQERVALIRTLRQAFGPRFVGGAIADPFARERYSDVVSPLSRGMRGWPQLVRSSLIAVYSRGLHDSIAFKMSEYLAASRCIVAEPPSLALPEPLVAGTNFESFNSPEECVARCEQLLSDPAKALEMRRRNWLYYRSQVEPAAQLMRVLQQSFASDSRISSDERHQRHQ